MQLFEHQHWDGKRGPLIKDIIKEGEEKCKVLGTLGSYNIIIIPTTHNGCMYFLCFWVFWSLLAC